jgi:hypothetical protein
MGLKTLGNPELNIVTSTITIINLNPLSTMAKAPNFGIIGTLNNISFYKMRGCDDLIARRKGGPPKERIKKHPNFEHVRFNNKEFGGRSAASAYIMRRMHPLKALADHNIAGKLNALLRPIQISDPENDLGSRHVKLSKNPRLLEGFNLNKNNTFDAIVRSPVLYTLSKETISARVDIPALLPGINFFNQITFPAHKFIAVLGVVPDLFRKGDEYKPTHDAYDDIRSKYVETDWFPVSHGSPATTLELKLDAVLPDNSCCAMLSIGICFGAMGANNQIEQIKYTGAAKILAMV